MKPVLGRDPFSRPNSPVGLWEERPKPKKRSIPKKQKVAAPERPPNIEDDPNRPIETPESETHSTSPMPMAPKQIDRQELLNVVEPPESSFQNSLFRSTRFVRPSFYGTKLGQFGMRFHSQEVDSFGYDALWWEKVKPFFDFLFNSYWRVQLKGVENIPAQGRILMVANHSGTLPYDGAMLKLAIENYHPSGRPVRFLVEDSVFYFPFLGSFINRIGGVRACQDNARRLLDNEQLVVVFPEGIKGIGKLFSERYKLQRFGRGGFIKLALRSNCPIVPVALVGAEEIHPMLARLSWLAKPLGLPYVPITPTFPWLGPLGAIPLPSRWIIEFGKPIQWELESSQDAENPLKVTALTEKVRNIIQQMVDGLLREREHTF